MPVVSQLPSWLLLHLPPLVPETRAVLRPLLFSLVPGAGAHVSAAHPQFFLQPSPCLPVCLMSPLTYLMAISE